MRKSFLLWLAFTCITSAIIAQESKTKVLLLGCFHFDNPGLDVAKFENANILSEKRQQEVKEVFEKLKQFNPDKIFVEVPVEMQAGLDSNLTKYKNGQYTLKGSETQQLGYRLAADLKLPTLYAVDYTKSSFPFDSLMKSATEAGQVDLLSHIKGSIDSIQKDFNESLKTKTISQLLLAQNTDAVNQLQVGFYFDLLFAGKMGNHVGSYLTSEWWRRNMIIYENILKHLDGREKNILIIFGSGHTALLKEMMKYNKKFELVPVRSVL